MTQDAFADEVAVFEKGSDGQHMAIADAHAAFEAKMLAGTVDGQVEDTEFIGGYGRLSTSEEGRRKDNHKRGKKKRKAHDYRVNESADVIKSDDGKEQTLLARTSVYIKSFWQRVQRKEGVLAQVAEDAKEADHDDLGAEGETHEQMRDRFEKRLRKGLKKKGHHHFPGEIKHMVKQEEDDEAAKICRLCQRETPLYFY